MRVQPSHGLGRAAAYVCKRVQVRGRLETGAGMQERLPWDSLSLPVLTVKKNSPNYAEIQRGVRFVFKHDLRWGQMELRLFYLFT